ncbi:potassium-transporting ATPase subunit KdpC [Azospirillum sp. RWY-5-1]|uniref:Potassium-transporting ATPase KdpC subunit n=1 Tax=Azospirillum oleiclasticum TaxID=2735135 RepID=A0ABX2TFU3_9PROT|nr:potassium-transporting ATPase subunit KdpC [Azospirillum oleiclasticum]NYZ15607.1 potassium-transporting ATPase subunit KdpC [Azospirillum oleiclasticum]NYZ22630.1 potassium-transporting ATPase subunit KdpC [Azospirillum oleiclasticum]
MLKDLRPAVSLLVVMTVLTGLVYPLTVTGLAGLLFPWQAAGSLVERGGTTVGSTLIAQPFTRPDHLQPRPSAAGEGYDAASSGASNLGPTSKALVERVAARVAALRAANPDSPGVVPAELVTASGSGLDPHLSPATALWQAPRIAKARGLPLDTVRAVIERHTEGRQWGLLGEPRVNVLLVNLELDGLAPAGGLARIGQ